MIILVISYSTMSLILRCRQTSSFVLVLSNESILFILHFFSECDFASKLIVVWMCTSSIVCMQKISIVIIWLCVNMHCFCYNGEWMSGWNGICNDNAWREKWLGQQPWTPECCSLLFIIIILFFISFFVFCFLFFLLKTKSFTNSVKKKKSFTNNSNTK